MNIFYKVALQGLIKNRTRTIVTIIGVILSTAMFTAIATFGTTLIQYMIHVEIAKGGNWHVTFSDVAQSKIQEWKEDPKAADVISYENIGYAVLSGAGEQSAQKPYLFIAGFEDETYDKLPVSMTSGRLPQNGGEIIVPAGSIAIKAGIRISPGDTLTLSVGKRVCDGAVLTQCNPYMVNETLAETQEKTYTVVGTFERPGFESHSSAGYTVITKSDDAGQADSCSLFVTLKNPREARSYAAGRKLESPSELNEDLLRFMGISDNRLFNTFLYTIGGVLVSIVMTGSVFLIYNAFYISLNERVHQFGILMSVGATAKQLRESVLFEGVCIGIVGIPLGVLAGVGSVGPLLPVVSLVFSNILSGSVPLTLAVSFPALAAAACVSFITILISAYIPARKAVSMPVMECIRQTNEIKTEADTVRTSETAWRLYGLEGTLALKNSKRNKKRYRSIVLSLTLSVVLAVSGNAFSTALKKISGSITTEQADGDVIFSTQDMPEEQFLALYDTIKDTEGVYRSTWQADPFYTATTEEFPAEFLSTYRAAMGDDSTGQAQQITLYTMFIEDEIYYEFIEKIGLPLEEYSGENAKVLLCAMNSVEHVTFFQDVSMNFTLISPQTGQTKTICCTFENSYPLDGIFVLDNDDAFQFMMTAPLSLKSEFDGIEPLDGCVRMGAILWSKTPSQTLAGIQKKLISEEVAENYNLINVSQAFELMRNINFVIDIFTYIFVFMLSLIATANVFNTISTNIRLRRRELAMLRSVGMSDISFNRMMKFECAFYGIRTLLYSIPIATLLSWLIHKVLMSIEEIEDAVFEFPWTAMGISVLGVFGIVFITMMYAASRLKKENIIDVLRDDMT